MRFEKTSAPVASREATISRISFSSAPLVGREREVAGVSDLLRQTGVRLITITGPGGVGKTRLAQAVADEIAADFPEGLWLVPLAAVRAPELVAGSVARVLGVSEAANRSLLDDIAAFLEQKKALLVLDNFEHLLGSAPLVAELLAKCPLLTCLVTSRALLRVSEEHAYPVPPLRLPPKSDATSVERASSSSAVRLFVMRAQAVQPDFEITTANAAQIEAICRRLDGLPLALELAAARVRHFAAEELAARLVGEERGAALRVLTGGPRDAPSRQQTLHFAIAWSHDLLTPEERVLFRRLAVFVGGFTLEAAEAVVHALDEVPGDVVEGIATLVDQSLLRHDVGPGGVSRYCMLETVREFALEQLVAGGEDATAQNAHSAYFLALAEQAAPRLYTEQQQAWLERLQVEHANLREVLARGQQGRDMALALRLAASLWRFWHRRGYWAEGLGWLHRLLTLAAAAEEIDPGARSSALAGAGWLAHYQNDFSTAQDALQKAEESYYRLGMTDGLIEVRHCQALVAQSLGQHQRAAELCEEALTFSRACGDSDMIAESLCNLSRARRELGEYERASALALEALRLRRGERHRSAAHALLVLGDVARDLGETDDARMRGEESLSIFRALGDPLGEGFALHNLAVAAYHDGDLDRARTESQESMPI
jgi:predicted ATPase